MREPDGALVRCLCRVGDHLLQVCAGVALVAREVHQVGDLVADFALCRCADDADAPSGAHLQESFVAEGAQRAEHRVGVDAHHGCEVSGGW